MEQLMEVVNFLHVEKDCVHRDIRASNFIVTTGMNLKLIDFGHAEYKKINKLVNMDGAKNYLSPEINEKKVYDGRSADIFALGVLLFHMVIGRLPFEVAMIKDNYYSLIILERFK